MVRIKPEWKWLGAGVLITLLFTIDWNQLWRPVPYDNVVQRSKVRVKDYLYYHYTFEKKGCKFIKASIIGTGLSLENLPWENTTASQSLDKFVYADRIKGLQSWRFRVKAPVGAYDAIIVRTRHQCEDKYIDKVFMEDKEKLNEIHS